MASRLHGAVRYIEVKILVVRDTLQSSSPSFPVAHLREIRAMRGLRFMFAPVSDDMARCKRHALMYALVNIAADAAAARLLTSRRLRKRWAIRDGT